MTPVLRREAALFWLGKEKRHVLRNREDREDHRRNMNPHRRQYYRED